MKTLGSFIRIVLLVVAAYIFMHFTLGRNLDDWLIIKYPVTGLILLAVLLYGVAMELSGGVIKKLLYFNMSDEAKARYDARQAAAEAKPSAMAGLMSRLTKAKPIESEDEILLDHNYDGILELDNALPPWWVYGFFITIIFAGVYLVRYEILGAPSQKEEYEMEMEAARLEVEEYLATAPDLLNVDNVTLLTEEGDLAAGQKIFETTCVACHKADGGGGIGPNLTDEYWILGGGIKNVFHTVSEGGRDGKGMVPWKSTFSPTEIAQVSSYVLSLQGTTPAEPKAAEGDKWVPEPTEGEATEEAAETTTEDSK